MTMKRPIILWSAQNDCVRSKAISQEEMRRKLGMKLIEAERQSKRYKTGCWNS